MATATELIKECKICALTFVNPKLLPCHHTFCEACVKKMTKGSRLVCPNCRKECHAREIVSDFRLDEFLQVLKDQEERLTKPKTETITTGTGKCEHCGKHRISCYCKDCDQWICANCNKIHLKMRVTKDHQIQSLASKNEEIKVKLGKETTSLKNKMKDYERVITAFQSESDKTKAIQLSTLEESKISREKLHKEIDERCDAIDSEVLDSTDKHIALIDQAKEKFARKYHQLDREYKEVEKQINENPQIATEGNSILKNVKKLIESAGNADVHFRSITVQLCRDRTMDISKMINLSVQTGDFNTAKVEVARQSLESVSSKEWRRHHCVSLPYYPTRLRLIHGELWQCYWGGIVVYDAALQQLRTMDSDDMAWVYDVAPVPYGEVAVAAENGLYTMTASGQQCDTIAKGSFTGVVQHRGRVYAVNAGTCTVHVYKDDWAECYSFSVNATKSNIITLSISKDLLYACLSNEHRLDVFTLSGELQYCTGSEGAGAAGLLGSPRICATEASGAALIADFSNDRLQVLSARRQWSTVSLQPPVERPRSALLLVGKLYVSSWTTEALYMYE